jgi:DNA-binding transcriptional regulator LsrR (DeoR family)
LPAKSISDIALLVRVASLYYLEDRTQEEIASALGLSRPKVGRLLQRARAEGLVEIRVHTPGDLRVDMETRLAERFGLQQALLVGDTQDQEAQRTRTAQAAAAFLTQNLRPGQIVAVGMGRNVSAVADQSVGSPPCDALFISAIGGSSLMASHINSNDICRRLAMHSGGRSEELYAPAYAENPQVRDSFLQHDDVRQSLARAREARIALVSVGDARSDSAVVRIGCFTAQEMERLRNARAVGDILGSFFDLQGRPVAEGMQDRVIGLDAEELRRIPLVIGVVSEKEKAQAVLGALRTGILNVLVTTLEIAQHALLLDLQTEK